MNFKHWTYLILFVMSACQPGSYEDERLAPSVGINNAYLHSTGVTSYANDTLDMYFDIGVVYSGQHLDNTSLPDDAFTNFNITGYRFYVDRVEHVQNRNTGPVSNIIAIDVSSDWNDVDLFNLRTTSWYKSVLESAENPQNEVAVGAFTRGFDGSSSSPVYVSSIEDGRNGFEQTPQEKGEILIQIHNFVGASSNVYDACYQYSGYVGDLGLNTNKQLTMICMSTPDGNNSRTVNEIIARAEEKGVKVNLILIDRAFNTPLASIATRTGGFINVISSTSQYDLTLGGIMDKANPLFGSINRITSGNNHVYRVHYKVVKSTGGSWFQGNVISSRFQLDVKYSDGTNRVNNQMPFYVEVP